MPPSPAVKHKFHRKSSPDLLRAQRSKEAGVYRSDDAIAPYDEVIRRFGDASDPSLRKHVVEGAGAAEQGHSARQLDRGPERRSRHHAPRLNALAVTSIAPGPGGP